MSKPDPPHHLGQGASAAYSMAGALLLFGGIGYLLDKHSTGDTWYLLAGLLLGVAVGMYELAKIIFPRK